MRYVLGEKRTGHPIVDQEVFDEDNSRGSYKPDFSTRKAEETVKAAVSSSSADEDDALSYFQKLAEE